jgi:glycosyltransferase involved in cell wall biosynthesis
MSNIYGVLVTYRRPGPLRETLGRLTSQRRRLDRLALVDNEGSSDARGALEAYRSEGREADYLAAPENLGPAGGIALGMRHVMELARDDDWVLVLDDDDPPPHDDAVAELEAFAAAMTERDPRTAAVGLVGARFDWRRGRTLRPEDGELGGPVTVDYVGGNQLPFIRAGAIRRVGPFLPKLFFGLDDLEFGLRLRSAGYSLYVDGHRWLRRRAARGRLGARRGPRTTLEEPTWRRYYSLRNGIYILRSHGRIGTALRVTVVNGLGKPLTGAVADPGRAVRSLRLNWRACMDAWTGRMGRTVEPAAPSGG